MADITDPPAAYVFDAPTYLGRYADLATIAAEHAGFDAQAHFWAFGIDEGRLPSIFFDIEYVQHRLRRIDRIDLSRRETIAYFFALPPAARFIPNRWFSPAGCRALGPVPLPDSLDDYGLFAFYLERAATDGLSPNGLFDEAAYRRRHPDAAALVAQGRYHSGFHHFMADGWRTGRTNLPAFGHGLFPPEARGAEERDTLFHRAGDIRQIVPWFSELFYLDIYPDIRARKRTGEFLSGLEHFLVHGRREGRIPHPSRTAGNADAEVTLSLDRAADLRAYLAADGISRERGALDAALWPFVDPPPVGGRFDAAHYLAANPDLSRRLDGDLDGAREHWRAHGLREGRPAPGSRLFANRAGAATDVLRGGGVNLFGPLSLSSGLGSAARGWFDSLREAGLEVDAHDVSGLLDQAAPLDIVAPDRLRHAVNLIALNPDQVPRLVDRYGTGLFDHRVNVGAWVWELAAARPEWRMAAAGFDLIVTPSTFCARAFAAETDVPVATVPYAVDRGRLLAHLAGFRGNHWIERLAEHRRAGRRIVLFVMDASSSARRKGADVFAEVARRAEAARPGRFLFVLKTHGSDPAGGSTPADRGLLVIDEVLSAPDLCKLKQSADLFLSPHRSEGFGLNIFESLVLGVPVICSRHGGPVDVLPAGFPFFIDGRLAEIGAALGPYRPSSVWFEPDPASATERLLAFFDDEAFHLAWFGEWQARLSRTLSARAVGERLADVLARHRGPARRAAAEEGFRFAAGKMSHALIEAALAPAFSIVTPSIGATPAWLAALHGDLCAQTCPAWEWCLATASLDVATLELARALRSGDARIRLLADDAGAAAEASSAPFLLFASPGDRLAQGLLAAYTATIDDAPGPDILSCDAGGEVGWPDWSPELLLSTMYLSPGLCVRKSLFLALGGFRRGFEAAQAHDLVLRAASAGARVAHVSQNLVRQDQQASSTEATRHAVADHLRRLGVGGTVEAGLLPGTCRARPNVPAGAVSLNILTAGARAADGRLFVANLVQSILAHDHPVEIAIRVIADADALAAAAPLAALDRRVAVVRFDRTCGFNFSDKANAAVRDCGTDRVVLLNDDMEALDGEWLAALLEILELPGVGVVGGRLLYGDDTVQHVGLLLGGDATATHVAMGQPADMVGPGGFGHVIRNHGAVTGALMAFRRTLFDQVGGFDPGFPVDFNDVDFCLRVIEAGRRVVFTPFARMRHFESRSAPRLAADAYDEHRFRRIWRRYMERDPYAGRVAARVAE